MASRMSALADAVVVSAFIRVGAYKGSIDLTDQVTAATLTAPFTQVNYIGAFSGPGDGWTVGWTCNSDVADLRGANRCTDIRVN